MVVPSPHLPPVLYPFFLFPSSFPLISFSSLSFSTSPSLSSPYFPLLTPLFISILSPLSRPLFPLPSFPLVFPFYSLLSPPSLPPIFLPSFPSLPLPLDLGWSCCIKASKPLWAFNSPDIKCYNSKSASGFVVHSAASVGVFLLSGTK